MDSTIIMDAKTVIGALLLCLQLVVGWILRGIMDAIKRLELKDEELATYVADLRVALPTVYVPKEDFKEMGDNIFATLRRIEDKIDLKADKS